MKRIVYLTILLAFSTLLIHSFTFGFELFSGKVINIDRANKSVTIDGNSNLIIKEKSILYIKNDDLESNKAILKVTSLENSTIKAKMLFGNIDTIINNDKVSNNYKFDSYVYNVKLTYKVGEFSAVSDAELIFDNDIYVQVNKKPLVTLTPKEITKLYIKKNVDNFIITKLSTFSGDVEDIYASSIDGLKSLINKQLTVTANNKMVVLKDDNLQYLEINGKIRGCKTERKFNLNKRQSVTSSSSNNNKYNVTFSFIDVQKGIETLEQYISDAPDAEKENYYISFLKLLDNPAFINNIKVGIEGSFNNYNFQANLLEKKDLGIWTTTVELAEGDYDYQYVMLLINENKKAIAIPISDPYSLKTKDVPNHGLMAVTEVPVNRSNIAKITPEQINAKLRYPFSEINKEENSYLSKVAENQGSSVSTSVQYYSATFKFDQPELVKTELKKQINAELLKPDPDQKKIEKWEDILSKFDRNDIDLIYVVGEFNNWQTNQYAMKKNSNGIWETTIQVPSGTFEYKYQVPTTIQIGKTTISENVLIADLKASKVVKNETGQIKSLIEIIPPKPILPEEPEKDITSSSETPIEIEGTSNKDDENVEVTPDNEEKPVEASSNTDDSTDTKDKEIDIKSDGDNKEESTDSETSNEDKKEGSSESSDSDEVKSEDSSNSTSNSEESSENKTDDSSSESKSESTSFNFKKHR